MRFTFPLVGTALGALLGCTGVPPAGTSAQESSPIIDGIESPASDDGVLFLQHAELNCSSVLIAPNAVLTALHCVASQPDSSLSFACSLPSGDLKATSPNAGKIGATLDPTTITIRSGLLGQKIEAHGKKVVGTGTFNICHNDIAIVILDTSLDFPIAPLRLERETKAGERGRAIGYGDIDGNKTFVGRHYRDDLLVLAVGGDQGNSQAAPNWVVTGEGPCHGDSGGPLLSEDTGAVIGVYSLNLSPSCTGSDVRNAYTELAPFAGLIRSALKDAGTAPVVEPPEPAGTGAGGEGNGGEGGVNGVGQAGDPGTGDAGGETGSGGSSITGGSGGSGATSAAGGSADGATGGTSTAESGGSSAVGGGGTTSVSKGSGSRRDGGCAVRANGSTDDRAVSLLGALLAVLVAFGRRRSWRAGLER
jgi:hypothetical protein